MKIIIRGLLVVTFILAISLAGIKVSNLYTKSSSIPSVDGSQQFSATASLPSKYDLREDIDIGVENQNPYGICYAYASLTSLETYLALNYGEYYDFSEVHFAVSLYKQAGYYDSVEQALKDGGNFSLFTLYSQKDNAIVLEEEMPLSKYLTLNTATAYSTMENDYNAINNNYYSIAKVNDTVSFPKYIGNKSQYSANELTAFRNSVKTHLTKYGSLTAGIHSSDYGFTYKTVNYKITDNSLVTNEQTAIHNTNHLVSIVGWDDNYDANGTWSNKGAYICLNSWGENFGLDGYFYVSYDDYFIESSIQGISNASLSTTNNKISSIQNYQDNTFIVTHTLQSDLFLANIFNTSKNIGESITHIDSFVKGGNAKFYIRFYDSHSKALSHLNAVSVMDLKSSSKVGEFSLYNKYQLSSPVEITGNYMLVISQVNDAVKTYSLAGYTSKGVNLEPTYYNSYQLGYFSTSIIWPSSESSELSITMPLVMHTNKSYIGVSKFSSTLESVVSSKYIKNNAIFYNKTISLTLNNTLLTEQIASNVKVTKLYNKSFSDNTHNFDIQLNNSNTLNITMTGLLSSSFKTGLYLISVPISLNLTIYRVIEVQDVVTFPITYYLDGGVASNPKVYTNKHTTLNLTSPTKAGYTFVGWYTDSEFTQQFDANNLPKTSLTLYAKYDFATPTITNKTKNVSVTYKSDLDVEISITASHALLNQYNTLSYQWYTRKSLQDAYTIIDGATTNKLNLNRVNQSGYYACEVSINISDTNLVDTPCIKTLPASSDTEIYVNIKPYVYDMSKTVWNYTQPISYDAQVHTVELINLPSGVTVEYANNSASEVGTYTATATLKYDNMDNNAIISWDSDIVSFEWAIRRAKITIKIEDITSTTPLTSEVLSSMYSCTITNEYLPAEVVSYQDKINFLELHFILQDTSQPKIKTINATHKTFSPDVYEIEIITGKYCVVVYDLNDNNISSHNSSGFVSDCVFTASVANIDDNITKQLNALHLKAINSYNIGYSYLQDQDVVTINIPTQKDLLFENLSVYMIKDNKLVKVDNISLSNGRLSFTTTEQNAQYIIVKDDLSHTSNTQILIIIGICSIFIIISAYAVVNAIKHRRNRY